MLLFELKENEAVVINLGDDIVKVRWLPGRDGEISEDFALGIDAPRSVSIDREEIYLKKRQIAAIKEKKGYHS